METIRPYNFEPVRNAGEMSESESGGSDDDDQILHVPDTRTERLENTDWCTCGLCIVMPSIT